MERIYTIDNMTQKIIDDYQLKCENDKDYNAYRQRICRALDKLDLLKKGIKRINPETKKKCRYYTEKQVQQILSERTLYDYLRDHSLSINIKNSMRYDDTLKAIEERRNAYIAYLGSLMSQEQNDNDDDILHIRDVEFLAYKTNIMISALFEMFFSPINDQLLKYDLEKVMLMDESNLQVEDIEAEYRLTHPEGSYFHKKREIEKCI